ncbi:MAG: hypothetical protein RQ752_08610, partial [Thermohalobaculum sp.]|nr:hypothetical protein [Thermohalobaculum sp.]
MPRCLRRLVALIAAGLCFGAPSAMAGAWTRAEGTGIFITSSGRKVAPVGAFAGGIPESDKTFAQVLVEYGLFDDLTIGARVYGDVSATDPTDGTLSASAAVRQRLYRDAGG